MRPKTNLVNYQETLGRIITNIKGNIYGFKSALNHETIGHIVSHAATKRTNIRSVLLNEYCAVDKESRRKLLIEAQAKDQQKTLSTIGRYIVMDRISNLAIRYIEQSAVEVCYRFAPTDAPPLKPRSLKDIFYIPNGLEQDIKKQFQQNIKQIINLRERIVKQLTDYLSKNPTSTNKSKKSELNNLSKLRTLAMKLTKPLIPVATNNSIVLYASIDSFKKLINQLNYENLPELQLLAKNLYQELQVLLSENINGSKENQNPSINFKSRSIYQENTVDLISKYLPKIKTDTEDELALIQHSPRNEINLIDEVVYGQSDNSAIALKTALGSLAYDKKLELYNIAIQAAITGTKLDNSILGKISYEFDTICDYGIIIELLRKKIIWQIDWQDLTPRHGFAVPNLIDEAGATEEFEQAFNVCLNLYCLLQTNNLVSAQYATMLGHKQRVKLSVNGNNVLQINKLRKKTETYPGVNELLRQICNKIAEVHPLLSDLISR